MLETINLLPGPVCIHEEVRKEFCTPPISHRSAEFISDFDVTKKLLCDYVKAKYVEIFTGSGTFANEVVAAQISQIKGCGIILVSGEFSERLVTIANRNNLRFIELRKEWGENFCREEIETLLDCQLPQCAWIWTVHCETSSGVLNNIDMLKEICATREIKLCLDCISSIATVNLDLSNVYLASATSGKAISAYAGLSMVFYNHEVEPSVEIPLYLDLGYYRVKEGIPFTISSCAVYALKRAVKILAEGNRYERIRTLSSYIRKQLLELGMHCIVCEDHSSPAVITFSVPTHISSQKLGMLLEDKGYLLSYNSAYLVEKNWMQICLMGNLHMADLRNFKTTFSRVMEELK